MGKTDVYYNINRIFYKQINKKIINLNRFSNINL